MSRLTPEEYLDGRKFWANDWSKETPTEIRISGVYCGKAVKYGYNNVREGIVEYALNLSIDKWMAWYYPSKLDFQIPVWRAYDNYDIAVKDARQTKTAYNLEYNCQELEEILYDSFLKDLWETSRFNFCMPYIAVKDAAKKLGSIKETIELFGLEDFKYSDEIISELDLDE